MNPSNALPLVHYQQVAEVYLEEFEHGPRQKGGRQTGHAIAEAWGVPLSTAHRWIKRARELGVLSPRPGTCSGRCGVHCPPTARLVEP